MPTGMLRACGSVIGSFAVPEQNIALPQKWKHAIEHMGWDVIGFDPNVAHRVYNQPIDYHIVCNFLPRKQDEA